MTMLDNLHILDDFVMMRPVIQDQNGYEIGALHTDLNSIQFSDGSQIDLSEDVGPDVHLSEALEAGSQLPKIEITRVSSSYDNKPNQPIYSWNCSRIVRSDFFERFENSFHEIGSISPCTYSQRSHSNRYVFAHITKRYFFSRDLEQGLTKKQQGNGLVFRDHAVHRLDCPYHDLDHYPLSASELPELFFIGNYLNLGYLTVKSALADEIDSFGDFEVMEIAKKDDFERDLLLTFPFEPNGYHHE